MKRLLAALLVAVPGCVSAPAANYAITYDSSTLLVTTPSSFWRSNLVDTAELTWDMTGGRATPTIAAALTRDSELTAALLVLATNLNASTAFSSGRVPIANLATGTPTGSKFLRDDGVLAVPAGGGGGDAYLSNTQTFTGTNSFSGPTIVSNLTVLGTMGVNIIEADSLVLGSPIGITALASNAAAARALLGVTYDVDVQSFSAHLHKIATNSWAANDLMLFNGSAFEALATTAAGRALLTAANAAAQRSSLDVGQLDTSAYGSGWNGVVDKTPTLDAVYDKINSLPGGSNSVVSVTAPLSLVDGVLSIDTSGLGGGGGGGYDYLVTNVGGVLQTRADGTNWVIISTTISSNHAPSSIGRFLEGQWAVVATNNSGTSATLFEDVYINGTLAFRDSYSYSSSTTPKSFAGHFWVVRESDTAATFVQLGGNANGAGAGAGFGDLGSSLVAVQALATNVPVNWASNVTFAIYYSCDTSVSTNSALGVRVANAWLRAERAASEAGTGDVVGPASATDGVLALFDGTTGKLLKNGNLTESAIATDSEVAAGYQPLDADLTDLADGSLTGSKVGSGISGDNVTTGTVSDARIDTAIARLASPAFTGDPTVPTALSGDADTSAASTLFVAAAMQASVGSTSGFRVVDELLCVTAAAGDRGTTGVNNSGAIAFVGGHPGRPGIRYLRTAAVNAYPTFGWLGSSSSHPVYVTNGEANTLEFSFRSVDALSTGAQQYDIRGGFIAHGTVTGTNMPPAGAFLVYGTNWVANGNFGLVTVSNSVASVTDTGIAYATSTWYDCRIRLTTTNAVLWIEGNPVSTNTTLLPAGYTVAPVIQTTRWVGTDSKDVYIDRLDWSWSGTAR